MKTIVISQPMFFPWVGMLEQIRLADTYVHYDDVQLPRGRSFITRVQIKTAQGSRWMTLPVLTKGRGFQKIQDVEVNEAGEWRKQHIGLLTGAYAKAPYFNDMMEIVEDVYSQETKYLGELTQYGLEKIADYLGITTRFLVSSEIGIGESSTEKLLGIVQELKGSVYVSGPGALNYLKHDLFEAHNIRVEYMDYKRTPYPQLHGEFDPHVSILDLICNCGKEGGKYIRSTSKYWKDYINERDRKV